MRMWICLALAASAILCGEAASDLCKLPVDLGSGNKELEKFYFDSAEGKCKRFTYSGRKGNGNRFATMNACEKECSTKPEGPQACTVMPTSIEKGEITEKTDSRGRKALEFSCNAGYAVRGFKLITCCNGFWDADMPTCVASDCKTLLDDGETEDGKYSVNIVDEKEVEVTCDMTTGGGGWTYIQRRQDASVDFYRPWADYQQGFGVADGNFWIGLDYLHALTATDTELYVYMEAEPGETRYAQYGSFAVAGEEEKYKLSISGYTGSATDMMNYHNGMKFSTKDQDNDHYGGDCAELYQGGWWYRACHHANPNGLYLNGKHASYADGINWYGFKNHYYSMKYFEMKVRRK